MILLNVDSCTDNSACLHLSDLWVSNSKTASTMSHHRVELVKGSDDCLDLLYSLALSISQFLDVLFLCRNELMKWRIKETNCYRISFKCLIEFLEVSLLLRKDLSKCCFSLLYCLRADHLTECINSVALKEHMLCTAKTNSLCTKLTSFLSISRSISICTNFHCSVLVSPSHDTSELTSDLSIYSRDKSVIDVTCCTINGDCISFMELFTSKCEFLVLLIHSDIAASGYTAGSHTTSNYSCVRCHTTTNCQDTLSSFHTCDILWGCLKTNKNNFLSSCSPLNSVLCREYDLTASSSWRSTKTFTHRCSSFKSSCIELRMKKCIKVTRIDHCNSLFLSSHSLINEVTSDLKSSLCSSLTITCLKHIQFTMLYSKLHILHVSVVFFKCFANLFELYECFREFLFHFGDVHRCTNTGNNVFTLSICKEFTKQTVSSCSRVTCEGNTCTTVITHVTECHHLYVNSCTPGIRDIVVTTIYIRTWVVPGTEYGFDSTH